MLEQQYKYLGDRLTSSEYKGRICVAVKRKNGKCIRGKNGNMLVKFAGENVVVIGRLLRKVILQV